MRSFWSDPYLSIHAAGLALLPISLEVCVLAMAAGEPQLPWLEFLLIATAGIGPVLWMQWFRPFYIFSVLFIALRPEVLTLDQRRVLTRMKAPNHRGWVVLVAIALGMGLWPLYRSAAIAADLTPLPPAWRILGVFIAGLAFLGSNLFLQVPVAVLRVLLLKDTEFTATPPYALEQIAQDFTIPGWGVNQIVPPWTTGVNVPAGIFSAAESQPQPSVSELPSAQEPD
ncbi:low-complexity tail membrane protein [Neosynechococcus sphagnicola]|uniref:low-complexity tail membrane protein n=1 Tax=Neosynechococcus sphagnicola TaxID=1501145 RepID=UPI000907BF03|nr:low-complexity tail membrane protein [Neosynechococcus sphagnicola]